MRTRVAALLASLSLCAGLLTGCGLKVQYWRKPPTHSYPAASSDGSPADASLADASSSSSSPDASAPDVSSAGASSGSASSSSGHLTDYLVDHIGVFSLPEGFEVSAGTLEDPAIPFVNFTRGDIHIQINRFGPEIFAEANTPMPATVEEYSRDPGAQEELPEGKSYQEDPYGNYSVSWTEGGTGHLLILMQGATSFASAYAEYPEGAEEADSIPLWMSLAALD